jgi:hypothetical protein
MVTSIRPITPKPKPVKGSSKRKESLFCKCKYLNVNRADYKICAKCKKPIRAKDIRKVLDILLNEAVKQIVLLRDGFCVTPASFSGHGKKRQPGHLISRGKKAVKWDLRNVHEQCDFCNARHEFYPEIYNNWYANKFGLESYNELCADGREVVTDLPVTDMEELFRQLTDILGRQKEDKTFKPYFTQKQILTGEWRGNDS